MSLRCVLLGHRHVCVGFEHYWDTSYGSGGVKMTDIRLICLRCFKPTSKLLDGWWTAQELEWVYPETAHSEYAPSRQQTLVSEDP